MPFVGLGAGVVAEAQDVTMTAIAVAIENPTHFRPTA